MIIFIQIRGWAIHWQVGGFDAERCRMVIARLELRRGHRPWYGWRLSWDEKPNWKELPTKGALRIERTIRGKSVAYVWRGPIESFPVSLY